MPAFTDVALAYFDARASNLACNCFSSAVVAFAEPSAAAAAATAAPGVDARLEELARADEAAALTAVVKAALGLTQGSVIEGGCRERSVSLWKQPLPTAEPVQPAVLPPQKW